MSICLQYQEELLKKYGTIPNRNTTEFLSERVKILHKNRTIIEALYIGFKKPILNAQVKHKNVKLL